MVTRVQWDARYEVGEATLDAQHRHFFELCNQLADCLDGDEDSAMMARFDALYQQLMSEARSHFAAERSWLASRADSAPAAIDDEAEEFAYLAQEIATTEHFDRGELQSFLALWWVGHVRGIALGYSATDDRD